VIALTENLTFRLHFLILARFKERVRTGPAKDSFVVKFSSKIFRP
jgi:hypothetical protein